MADTKKEYTSNLHPKGDMDTTVYPNVKSENIIDKDLTSYTAGRVPDSSLVQKSLDGISENLETTKIQVDTNKTNIATLQGDVASLKSDNETTKTTVAGLVSSDTTNKANIAKNTQNIENLSAVMPTDINVDANGYAILEHDGTEITGQKKNISVIAKTSTGRYSLYPIKNNEFAFELKNADTSTTITYTLFRIKNDSYSECLTFFKDQGQSARFRIGYSTLSGFFTYEISYNELRIKWQPTSSKEYILYYPKKSGTFALLEDLATKQDKRFLHTVEIHYASNGSYFCFTGTSDKNTPIDSVQDLTTVFANRDLCGVGIFGSAGLSKIHVGTSVNDTTFKKYMNNGEYTNPSEETFAMVFNTTGFTITDSVIPL